MRSNRHARANHRADCAKTRRLRAVRRLPAAGSGRPLAGVQLRQRGAEEAALYQLGTVAAEPVVATWDQGLRMQVDCTFSEDGDGPVDMIVVPGGPGVERASAHGETRAWLRRRDAGTRRTCSVCTGAFLLACAGLLDGRVVTTHWRSADRLRQLYPAAGGGRPPLRGQRQVLDLGRRLGRHRPGPGPDRARPRSRTVAAGGAPAGGLHAPRRRPAPVQPDPAAAGPRRRAVPRAGAEDGGDCRPAGRSTTWPTPAACRAAPSNASSSRISAWRPRKCCACCGASAPAPCRRPARCRRNGKAPGADGLTGPPRLPAGGMAALPRPTDTPPHTWISCRGHEGGAPVHEHGHHVRHLFRQAAAAHRDRGLQRARARIAGGFDALNSSVATGPGATVFTVMPSAASSSAQVRVMAASAPLDAP